MAFYFFKKKSSKRNKNIECTNLLVSYFDKKMQKQKQKILFIELKFGTLVSEMAQKPKGRQCVDKKARHFAKVKVDKTTKPS